MRCSFIELRKTTKVRNKFHHRVILTTTGVTEKNFLYIHVSAPMCFVRLLKHWYKEQTMQIKWGKHFSELFHVSMGLDKGEY